MMRGYTDPAEREVVKERSSFIPSQRGVPPPNYHLSLTQPPPRPTQKDPQQ